MRTTRDIRTPAAVELDDATLVERARCDDEAAFRAIFDRHVDALTRFATARVERSSVEDVVIEAFAEFWRTIDRFDTSQDLRPWLLGIATNRARRFATTEWRQATARVNEAHALGSGASLDDTGGVRDPAILAALDRLSDAEREVLVLVSVGELSIVEAARVIGITAAAARVRLFRARKAMTRQLRQEERR